MTVNLHTSYLGFDLRSPLVASSSPLTGDATTLRQISDAGAGAIVLPSLFEEEVLEEELQLNQALEQGSGQSAEAFDYFPAIPRLDTAFRDQPRTEALLRNRVATLYLQLHDDPQAEHQARRALALCRQEFPPDHAETLTATRTLATALERLGKAATTD